jgi:hypothetical protein
VPDPIAYIRAIKYAKFTNDNKRFKIAGDHKKGAATISYEIKSEWLS